MRAPAGEADTPQTIPNDRHRLATGRERRLAPSQAGERRAHKTPQARSIRRDHDRAAAGRIDERDRPAIRRDTRLSRMTTQNHVGADRACSAGPRRDELEPAPVATTRSPSRPRNAPQAGDAHTPTTATTTSDTNALGPIDDINEPAERELPFRPLGSKQACPRAHDANPQPGFISRELQKRSRSSVIVMTPSGVSGSRELASARGCFVAAGEPSRWLPLRLTARTRAEVRSDRNGAGETAQPSSPRQSMSVAARHARVGRGPACA